MTADNPDGGAVPPTTHFAIRECCLICGRAEIETRRIPEIEIVCPCSEHTRAATQIYGDFTLRDFGYPVRKVEVVPMRPNATECKYYAYFDSIAALCKHDESPNGDCTSEDCPINGAK